MSHATLRAVIFLRRAAILTVAFVVLFAITLAVSGADPAGWPGP